MVRHSFGAMHIILFLLLMQYGFISPTIKTSVEGFEEVPIVYEARYQVVESVCITTHRGSWNNA